MPGFKLMQLSVIILNYNVRYFLEQCILSVKKALNGIEGEIIVVDNNSADDSCAMVEARYPDVKLIKCDTNTGFPKGNNIGVSHASGKYICILNPDTVVAEDTFLKLIEFAGAYKNIGVVGPKLIDGRGCFLPESKRAVPTPWVAFTRISGIYKVFPKWRVFNRYYALHIPEDQTGITEVLVGAFMFMRRELYLEAGGFDEDCFMYSDDLDLSYTIMKKGYDNYYYPGTVVIHYKGESTVKDGLYMQRFREAMQFFYKKHFRKSPSFDIFMRFGSILFMHAKKNKKGSVYKPKRYVLFSPDAGLEAQIKKSLAKPVSRINSFNPEEALKQPKATEFIFDSAHIAHKDIIEAMQKISRNGYTFKIRPADTSFIIGSNSSNDRGEVIVF